jgi:penicillin-binding protein 1A
LGQGARTALPLVGEFLKLSNQDEELNSITRAQFTPLPNAWARKIDCDLYRSDNFLERLVAKKDKQKEFGKKEKKGFFKRLFEKK